LITIVFYSTSFVIGLVTTSGVENYDYSVSNVNHNQRPMLKNFFPMEISTSEFPKKFQEHRENSE